MSTNCGELARAYRSSGVREGILGRVGTSLIRIGSIAAAVRRRASARGPRATRSRSLATPILALLLCILPGAPWASAQDTPLAHKARGLMDRGDYGKALDLLKKDQSGDPRELRLLVELSRRKGDLEQADVYAQRILDLYQRGRLSSADELAQAAFANWHLDRWQEANNIYLQAQELGTPPASMLIDWGNLYLEKYNAAEAQEIFAEALQGSPEDEPPVEALVGLALAFKSQGRPGGQDSLNRALEADPKNLNAISALISWAIGSENWDEAEEWIEKGLDVNKRFLPILEQKTVMHYFRGQGDDFEESQRRILKINPRAADLYEALGNAAVNNRRLEEAEGFLRKSVQLNPRQWGAWAALGVNLLRLGKDEGKSVLEKAYESDPFNIWTVNTLRLLDSFDRFVVFETPHFIVRLHRKEAEALRPYIEELLERCLTTLESRYQHEIEGKYLFEMFPDHEDFAVRTLGMPGLGALGATLGRIVAMDSPSGRPKGEFHYGSTLWHEVAHVVTLSMSGQKVPRWFTEGLSMMEERLAGAGWGESITPSYVQAFRDGQLLPLHRLNDGFQRPDTPQQVQLSYLQAGWVCDFLVERYGMEKIRAMLLAYADSKTTEQVFEEVLGASVEEVNREFVAVMEEKLTPLVERLRNPDEQGEGVDLSAIVGSQEILRESSDNYFFNLRKGRKLVEEDRDEEAIPYLEKALEIFPSYAGARSPYAMLATIHRDREDWPKTAEILERWWKRNPKPADNAIELAKLLTRLGEGEKAIGYLEEVMYVDPLRTDVHFLLGDLYLEQGRAEKAVREFQVLLFLKPNDLAGARYRLAKALYMKGDRDLAKRQVLLSLEIAPGYREAQELLLKVVKQ